MNDSIKYIKTLKDVNEINVIEENLKGDPIEIKYNSRNERCKMRQSPVDRLFTKP